MISKKNLLIYLVVFLFCNCNNESKNKNEATSVSIKKDTTSQDLKTKWQFGSAQDISYLYPPDWIKNEEVRNNTKRVGITPIDLKNLIPFYLVEIFEFEKQGHSFQEFTNESISFISKYQDKTVNVINNKDYKVGGHSAKQIQGTISSSDKSYPITFYPIEGSSKFYLFINNGDDAHQQQINGILNTITFQ